MIRLLVLNCLVSIYEKLSAPCLLLILCSTVLPRCLVCQQQHGKNIIVYWRPCMCFLDLIEQLLPAVFSMKKMPHTANNRPSRTCMKYSKKNEFALCVSTNQFASAKFIFLPIYEVRTKIVSISDTHNHFMQIFIFIIFRYTIHNMWGGGGIFCESCAQEAYVFFSFIISKIII